MLQAMLQLTEVNLISKKLSWCNIYFNHSICWTKIQITLQQNPCAKDE